jgi:predicted TIM-barrel fold metal-dependent hydrolase
MIYTGLLIDAHHHFWDIGMAKHPWLAPAPGQEMVFGAPAPLYRNYLPADLEADARGQTLVASVHVEAGWDRSDPIGETAWLSELARAQRLPTVLVAYAPLDDPEIGKVLEAQSACPLVRGVRFVLSWHEDAHKSFVPRADYMIDRQWLEGFALLARFGLSFDLMLYPGQMAEAARLAARFPKTLILVNHAGSPADRDEEAMARWRAGLRALVAYAISGFSAGLAGLLLPGMNRQGYVGIGEPYLLRSIAAGVHRRRRARRNVNPRRRRHLSRHDRRRDPAGHDHRPDHGRQRLARLAQRALRHADLRAPLARWA